METKVQETHESNFLKELCEWTEETVRQNLVRFQCHLTIKDLEKKISHLKEKVEKTDRFSYN